MKPGAFFIAAPRQSWSLHSQHKALKPVCLWKISLACDSIQSQNRVPSCHDNRGWHTTVKVPNDEWLLKPVCAYVSLFGLAISWNEDNNIAYWHRLNVLFCLSISWHQTHRRPLCYTITRLTLLYQSFCVFKVLNPLQLCFQPNFQTFKFSWKSVSKTTSIWCEHWSYCESIHPLLWVF